MLAAALLNYVDDEGYFNANPKLVKSECLPLREPSVSVHDSLISLQNIGWLRLGTAENGRIYGHILTFSDHQVINRKTPSKIKAMRISWEGSRSTHTQLSEPSHLEGKGNKEKERESREGTRARATAESKPLDPKAEIELLAGALFKRFRDAYPAKRIKSAAREKFLALLRAGENADQIVAHAATAPRGTPAEDWLDQRPWDKPAPKPTPPRPTISPDANDLAIELAKIAGQDPDFLEPGWCGAAYRCQQWLNEGYGGCKRGCDSGGGASFNCQNAPVTL